MTRTEIVSNKKVLIMEDSMQPLYMASTSPFSGKTLITIGIGKIVAKHHTLGYMKPYGKSPMLTENGITDQDVVFIKEVLGLDAPVDILCPALSTHDFLAKRLDDAGSWDGTPAVESAYRKLSIGKDAFLLGGSSNMYDGISVGLSPLKIVRKLNARVLLVDQYKEAGACIDCILATRDLLKDRLAGVIINRVPPEELEYVNERILPYLELQGVNSLGVIPNDDALGSVSISQINNILGGEILSGDEYLDKTIDIISAITAKALDTTSYFAGTQPKKTVITSGKSHDVQLEAIATPTTGCLVLTGSTLPEESILLRAAEKQIPVIRAKADICSTMEILKKAISQFRIREHAKVQMAVDLVGNNLDMEKIYEAIGLTPRPDTLSASAMSQ